MQCCKCRKRLVDKLVEECNEYINEEKLLLSEMANVTLSECKNVCHFCIIYVLLFAMLLKISKALGVSLSIFIGT